MLSALLSLVRSMSKAATSSRLNLRSLRGPTRYVFIIPCSLHRLSVLACMQRIRHASPVRSILLGVLTPLGMPFLVRGVYTVPPLGFQHAECAGCLFDSASTSTPLFYKTILS